MKTYQKKICAVILSALIAAGMFGCSQKEPVETTQTPSQETTEPETPASTTGELSRSAEEIASDFCTVWADKWSQIEKDGVTSSLQGRAFLADMDNDGSEELIFLYDNDVNFDAVVYKISGEKTEELGGFTLSNTSPELNFTVYQGKNGAILKHIAVRELSSETDNETEESYITLKDGKISQEVLFSTSYAGVDTYYDSIMAGANEVTLEEFDAMREKMLDGSEKIGTVTFTPEDFVDFSDTQALETYLKNILSK